MSLRGENVAGLLNISASFDQGTDTDCVFVTCSSSNPYLRAQDYFCTVENGFICEKIF